MGPSGELEGGSGGTLDQNTSYSFMTISKTKLKYYFKKKELLLSSALFTLLVYFDLFVLVLFLWENMACLVLIGRDAKDILRHAQSEFAEGKWECPQLFLKLFT